MQTFETSHHPSSAANNAGSGQYNLIQANFSDPTINILAGYNNRFFDDKFSFSGQVGYHQMENAVTRQATYGTRFVVPDFQSINNTDPRSEEHTSELQSLMRISYAVFCLKKKKKA